jgi:hypothetical protein
VDAPRGVVFPVSGDGGERSTSALARSVVAAALAGVDPIGARAVTSETNWRHGYLTHFRRLLEAGLTDPDAARRIATGGLDALHGRMRFVRPDGDEIGIADACTGPVHRELDAVTVPGGGVPDREISLPYRGERLRGDALSRRLDAWVADGVIEPSCADAVRAVIANPSWLDLTDQRMVVLGAGAEMGPTRSLLRWGAEVVAVDLPRPPIWSRLLEVNARSGGRLVVPVPADSRSGADGLAGRAGADLLHDLPDVAAWLRGLDGRLVLGNYVYADGATNVRVAMAVDALSTHLVGERPETALAFLATPTDAFVVPADAVAHAEAAYRESTTISRLRRPIRVLSAGRLLRRNYAPGADPGICDSLVPQQGPNYALAKRLQRWRATVARAAGTDVCFKVAPPTRTRSVLRNRALAAAYSGAHLFGVQAFEPATSNTLMALLLVHDLRASVPAAPHPWQDEAFGAAHGGLWRAPYAPRSALGLAALLGFGGVRA